MTKDSCLGCIFILFCLFIGFIVVIVIGIIYPETIPIFAFIVIIAYSMIFSEKNPKPKFPTREEDERYESYERRLNQYEGEMREWRRRRKDSRK